MMAKRKPQGQEPSPTLSDLMVVLRAIQDQLIELNERFKLAKITTGKQRQPADVEYFTPSEFAKLMKISRSKVQSMMTSGAVKTITIPTADPDAAKQLRRIPLSEVARIKKTLGK